MQLKFIKTQKSTTEIHKKYTRETPHKKKYQENHENKKYGTNHT